VLALIDLLETGIVKQFHKKVVLRGACATCVRVGKLCCVVVFHISIAPVIRSKDASGCVSLPICDAFRVLEVFMPGSKFFF
jgi:hypothetical protein